MGKPRFDHNFKRELVEAYLSKQITTEEIKQRYGLTKHDVLRFKSQLEQLAEKLGVPEAMPTLLAHPMNQHPSASVKPIPMNGQGEETETQLKIQIADLTLELDRLKNKLIARVAARMNPLNKSLG